MNHDTTHFTHRMNLPFTAVIGCEPIKKALLLAAVNPSLGGVLIKGQQGVAKSTLARSLADLLGTSSLMQTLPLSATVEQLVGTLHIEKLLKEKKQHFQPGILARVDHGVLYIDEINLLSDHLTDALLDVCASGVNVVERDGISHSHPSRFVMIGTMNPEEGEVRAQFLDRFGLCVDEPMTHSQEFRIQVMKRNLSWQKDPQAVLDAFSFAQDQLKKRIENARVLLKSIQVPDAIFSDIAKRCSQKGVSGMRADISMLAASMANAALDQRQTIKASDVDCVADWVLCHRSSHITQKSAADVQDPSFDRTPNNGSTHTQPKAGREHNPASSDSKKGSGREGIAGAYRQLERSDAPLIQPSVTPQVLVKHVKESMQLKNQNPFSQFKIEKGNQKKGTVNWHRSIHAAGRLPQQESELLRDENVVKSAWIVLLDRSASTQRYRALEDAKAFIVGLATYFGKANERLEVIFFGGEQILKISISTQSRSVLSKRFDSVEACGGSPLDRGLTEANRVIQAKRRKDPRVKVSLVCLTDARSSFRFLPQLQCDSVFVVDLDRRVVRLGLGMRLARHIGAHYSHIDQYLKND